MKKRRHCDIIARKLTLQPGEVGAEEYFLKSTEDPVCRDSRNKESEEEMRSGKLLPEELRDSIFGIVGSRRKEVVQGVGLAEDCAVLKTDGTLLLTTDPITSASKNGGSLAIHVSANDIAASGGEPVVALLSLIMPNSCDTEDVKEIMISAESTAKKLNIEIAGGHTEFSSAVNRPVISCTMLGVRNAFATDGKLEPGDAILMTKFAGREATAIAANDYADKLSEVLSENELEEARNMIDMISVLPESKALAETDITFMHDITEGGVFGAVCEMCISQDLGAVIDAESIPVHYITKKICDKLGLNPYKMLSSGSMLIATPDEKAVKAILRKEGILCTTIGRITTGDTVVKYKDRTEVIRVESDEINKLENI